MSKFEMSHRKEESNGPLVPKYHELDYYHHSQEPVLIPWSLVHEVSWIGLKNNVVFVIFFNSVRLTLDNENDYTILQK